MNNINNSFISMIILFPLITACDKEILHFPEISFYYINESNHDVILSASTSIIFDAAILDSVVKIGDTIQYLDYVVGNRIDGPFGNPDSSSSVKVIFNDSAKKCVIFTGPIVDPTIDIRSQKAYTGNTSTQKCSLFYTITNVLYSKAILCN